MNRVFLNDAEIKQELKRVLALVDAFLSENNIEYSIDSGTLLGAVRHQGFIPWDDDIDIQLKISEYNRLICALKEKNSIRDELVGIGFELGNSEIPYLKIVSSTVHTEETVSQEGSEIHREMLWIDVFPIDNVPGGIVGKIYLGVFNKLIKSIWHVKRFQVNGWNDSKKGVQKAWNVILSIISRKLSINTLSGVYVRYCSLFSKWNTKYAGNLVWGTKKSRCVPQDFFAKRKEYCFEDIIVKGLDKSDEWLTWVYGDYMTLPPENKRVSHSVKAWKEI